MRIAFVVFFLFNLSAVAENFFPNQGPGAPGQVLCTRCKRPLFRCPRCGQWHHVAELPTRFPNTQAPFNSNQAPSHAFQNPSNFRSFVPPFQQPFQNFQQFIPPVQSFNSPFQSLAPGQTFDPSQSFQQPQSTQPAQSAQSSQSPVTPSVSGPVQLGEALSSSPSTQFDQDILYHGRSRSGEPISCNGAMIRKAPNGNVCRFAMITARHCVQDAGKTEHIEPFGRNYIQSLNLHGVNLQIVDIVDNPQGPDSALVIVDAPCGVVPDSKIGKLATGLNNISNWVYVRKSQLWGQPNHVFVDRSGRRLNMAGVAGRLISGFSSPGSNQGWDGFTNFVTHNGQTVQPGDSGQPIYNQIGEIVGVLSAYAGEGTSASDFFFASSNEWIPNALTRFGF